MVSVVSVFSASVQGEVLQSWSKPGITLRRCREHRHIHPEPVRFSLARDKC